MVLTRGAARKVANSLGEGAQKDQLNEDASVAEAGEGVDGEWELAEKLAGMTTGRGKLGGERNMKAEEAGTTLYHLNTLDSLVD